MISAKRWNLPQTTSTIRSSLRVWRDLVAAGSRPTTQQRRSFGGTRHRNRCHSTGSLEMTRLIVRKKVKRKREYFGRVLRNCSVYPSLLPSMGCEVSFVGVRSLPQTTRNACAVSPAWEAGRTLPSPVLSHATLERRPGIPTLERGNE